MLFTWRYELETRDEALQRGADAKILERAKELLGPCFGGMISMDGDSMIRKLERLRQIANS